MSIYGKSEFERFSIFLSVFESATSVFSQFESGDGTYAPESDFDGDDSFSYVVCDDSGSCATETVTVAVTPVNDPPIGRDENPTTHEDTPVAVCFLCNDSGRDGDPLALTSIPSGPSHGTIVINPDGTVTYTPSSDFNGEDMFSYVVCDGNGLCDTATVTVTTTAVNGPPLGCCDTPTILEDIPVAVRVLCNDSGFYGDPLTVTSVPSGPSHGSVVINPDGTVT